MANALIGFPNRVDASFVDVVFSRGDWVASMPLTNLRDPLLTNQARSVDATNASTQFEVDLGSPREITMAVITDQTTTRSGEYRLRYNDQIAWTDITVTGVESAGETTINLTVDSITNAQIRPGEGLSIAGDDTIYQVVTGNSFGENEFTFSEEFDNAAWTKTGVSVSIDVVDSPEEVENADKIIEDTSTGLHQIEITKTITADTSNCVSIFIKPNERDNFFISLSDAGETTGIKASFNITAGTISCLSFGSGVINKCTFEEFNQGFYRLILCGEINGGVTSAFTQFGLEETAGVRSYTGDGSSGIYYWGAQFELTDDSAKPYIKTTSTAGALTGDIVIKRIGTGTGLLNPTSGGEVVTCHSGKAINKPLRDTGKVEVWPRVFEFGSLPIGHPSFLDGKFTDEEIKDIKMPILDTPSPSILGRYLRFDLFDGTNPDNFIDLPRLFIASGWNPTINPSYGLLQGWESQTLVNSSLGGADFFEKNENKRTFRFSIDNLKVQESYTFPYEINTQADIHSQIFFILNPEDTFQRHRRSFLCRNESLNALQYPYFSRINSSFNFVEVIA